MFCIFMVEVFKVIEVFKVMEPVQIIIPSERLCLLPKLFWSKRLIKVTVGLEPSDLYLIEAAGDPHA
jgi:hypothetical protein